MTCETAKNYFMDYLYNEISADQQQQLEAHLRECRTCQQEIADLKTTSGVLQQWEAVNSPVNLVFTTEQHSFWQDIREKFRHLPQLNWSRRKWVAYGLGVALVLLSLINLEIRWNKDDFTLKMSLWPSPTADTASGNLVTQSELKALQQEQFLLMNQLIEASTEKQRQEITKLLITFARDVERQRESDLKLVGTSLEQLQFQTHRELNRATRSIGDLMQIMEVKGTLPGQNK